MHIVQNDKDASTFTAVNINMFDNLISQLYVLHKKDLVIKTSELIF